MLETWTLAVLALMNRASATWRLLRPSASRRRTSSASPAAGESATWDALKEWRTGIARRDKVPPYVVMSDAHLKGIAERRPSTLGELAACPGIGPLKLERYGDDILMVIERSG